MKAVLVEKAGGPENMRIGNYPNPEPQAQEILVRVAATALNRADTLQRQGKYPPPFGASPILGLEIAGEVVELGSKVTQWQLGDKVFGLVPGGAYAEYAVIHENMAMLIPERLSFREAAAIPEVFLTAYQSLVWLGNIQAGEQVLIHAAASGVGTAAIQLARELGAGKVLATASGNKHRICYDLGADKVIDYQHEDFAEVIQAYTQNQGVDIILDFIAAPYFQKNIQSLNRDGRLIILALMGGTQLADFNLAPLLLKRLQVIGSTLRSRSLEYQIRLTKELEKFILPKLQEGRIKPIIDSVYPWTQVSEAHAYMENNRNLGKIILEID